MRIGLVSLDQIWHDKDANFTRCATFVRRVAECGGTLAIFPEMTLTGYSMDAAALAEPECGSPTCARFGTLAVETGVSIVFGALLLHRRTGRPRNELCFARPTGTSEAIYAKLHPFSFVGEHEAFEAGDTLGAMVVDGIPFGVSICYDLRFPEIYAAMAMNSKVAVVIANWPGKRVSHWRTLLTARAIENQLYVLGVNRTGTDGKGLHYPKSSLAINPDGDVLTPTTSHDELDIFDIDPAETDRYRARFPTFSDKRWSIYRDLVTDQP